MKRAIISVSEKTGIGDLGTSLESLGFEIFSTGGTLSVLDEAGVKVKSISEITNFPEFLDGRVKTLHPNVLGGILAKRDDENHLTALDNLNIKAIDLVVVNLYPFKETILKESVSFEDAVENIDIGGPTMLRAAAKNHKDVIVITDPKDYKLFIDEFTKSGDVSYKTRLYLATKVFSHTAHYETLIANYFIEQGNFNNLGETLTLTFEKISDMRYGENPHQKASFYKEIGNLKGLLVNAIQLNGKALSFNNINDTNGALALLKEFTEPTAVACKHSNPCGIGSGENILDAYLKAYESDPVSIYGGIVVSNREIDEKTAIEMNKVFLEIILAPSFTDEALIEFSRKKNLRVLKLENLEEKQDKNTLDIKKVSGGIIVQTTDNELLNFDDLKCVTDRKPTDEEMEDLLFMWRVVKHVKSNGIAIGKDKQSLGIGTGQVSRIWATKQAIDHGLECFNKEKLNGAVLASDAFFPFSDCIEEAHKAGISAVIQPGGSIRDNESIYLCNKYNMAMVFTSIRHFKH